MIVDYAPVLLTALIMGMAIVMLLFIVYLIAPKSGEIVKKKLDPFELYVGVIGIIIGIFLVKAGLL